jgi:hypothetical protein
LHACECQPLIIILITSLRGILRQEDLCAWTALRAQALLGWVRMWLTGVAYVFFLIAAGMRIAGNGMQALGGLFAFTVVVSS